MGRLLKSIMALVAGLLCALPVAAQSNEKMGARVALIVANGKYQSTSQLTNPASDAQLVAESLKKVGFSSIEVRPDQSLAQFQTALREFRARATGAEVAMIYYAGHGIENGGRNWLIPVDAKLVAAEDLGYEAIDLDLLLSTIGGAKVRIAVVDACRNNPFAANWRAANRAVTNGLAKLEVDDVLVIFAAAPGQVAKDGNSGHSPFAEALAKRIPQPGLAVQLLGGKVRDDVLGATDGNQRPFISASMSGDAYYLVDAAASPSEGARLKELEDENRRLKMLLAEQMLKNSKN